MGWSMGWDAVDAHQDGRKMPIVAEADYIDATSEPGMRHPEDFRRINVYRRSSEGLTPDNVPIDLRLPFDATEWESLYSTVVAVERSTFSVATFAPVVDDSWWVVGHLGWADGNDILVPEETVQNDRLFWSVLQRTRLAADREEIRSWFGSGAIPDFSLSPSHMSPRPPSPGNCVYRPPPFRFRNRLDDIARGKEEQIEKYGYNLRSFVHGGGLALVGRHFQKRGFASYLDRYPGRIDGEVGSPKKPLSSGYDLLVLVDPEGKILDVMDIRKNLVTQHEKDAEILLLTLELALTITMVIEIAPLVVVLFRAGVRVATAVAIRAIRLALDVAAEAARKWAEREARRLAEAAARAAAEGAARGPVISQIPAFTGTRAQFRAFVLSKLRREASNPLRFLLNANGDGFKMVSSRAHDVLMDNPDIWEAGHIMSDKIGGNRLMIQTAWENQIQNASVEMSHIGGAALDNPAVEVGGLPVAKSSVKWWEEAGFLPAGTAARAPVIQ